MVASLGDVARHFAVSERTVGQWKKRGIPGSTRLYDLDLIARWRTEHIQQRPSKRTVDESLATVLLEQERLKRDVLMEKKRELVHRRRVRERNILPRDEFEAFLIDVVTVTRDAIQGFPSQLAKLGSTPQLQGSIYAETERLVRSTLQTMSELLQKKGAAFEAAAE